MEIDEVIDDTPERIMSRALSRIADAMESIVTAGLKKETLVVLIHDKTAISKRDIRFVLNSLQDMRKDWCV